MASHKQTMGASASKVEPSSNIPTSKFRFLNSTSSRDDPSKQLSILRQSSETSVGMKYPMWLVPVSTFVKLAKLEPHQVMRQRGELVMWEPSMKTVFFLSHQWTSFEHPDHTLDQMRCFKRLLIRMMKGEVATTVPDFAAQSTTTPSNHAPAFTDLHHVEKCLVHTGYR